jgi:hypothetical protein
MLIRSRISRDLFEEEPHSADWVGPAIVLIVLLAGAAALVYGVVNGGIPSFEVNELADPSR